MNKVIPNNIGASEVEEKVNHMTLHIRPAIQNIHDQFSTSTPVSIQCLSALTVQKRNAHINMAPLLCSLG